MNYEKHYNKLIDRARSRTLNGYCESHHIIPRCLGGTDDELNLVLLTAEEHYVAHQLLAKLYPSHQGIIRAVVLMTEDSLRRRNKLYGWLRRRHAENTRKTKGTYKWFTNGVDELYVRGEEAPVGWLRGRTRTWIPTDLQRKKISIAKTGKPMSDAQKKLRSDLMKGRPAFAQSAESHQRRSQKLKGKPWSAARRLAQERKQNERFI